jgi:anti-anti-sigma regulatory factor
LSEDASVVVVLPGTADVRSIAASFQCLEEAFAGALGGGASMVVDLSQVVDADITLIQLMESARRTAAQSGVAIRLSEPAQGPLLEMLERGGFLTDPPDEHTLFWRGK